MKRIFGGLLAVLFDSVSSVLQTYPQGNRIKTCLILLKNPFCGRS